MKFRKAFFVFSILKSWESQGTNGLTTLKKVLDNPQNFSSIVLNIQFNSQWISTNLVAKYKLGCFKIKAKEILKFKTKPLTFFYQKTPSLF